MELKVELVLEGELSSYENMKSEVYILNIL